MSDKTEMTEIERATLEAVARHRDTYIQSGGREGHIWDFSYIGGHPFTTTLLLETFGRKSGERRVAPLIYGTIGGEVLIVASKGGADVHPGWYFNLTARPQAVIQIGAEAFRCTWREPTGAERTRLWAFMTEVYPPYPEYQAATPREIPIIAFKPGERVAALEA